MSAHRLQVLKQSNNSTSMENCLLPGTLHTSSLTQVFSSFNTHTHNVPFQGVSNYSSPKCTIGPGQINNLYDNKWKIKQFYLISGCPHDVWMFIWLKACSDLLEFPWYFYLPHPYPMRIPHQHCVNWLNVNFDGSLTVTKIPYLLTLGRWYT